MPYIFNSFLVFIFVNICVWDQGAWWASGGSFGALILYLHLVDGCKGPRGMDHPLRLGATKRVQERFAPPIECF